MLVKNRLKNYYFKFWYLNYKAFFKDTLYNSLWFSTMQKKLIKNGNLLKINNFWFTLCKFFKKFRIKPLPLILKNSLNLDTLISFIEVKRRNYKMTFPTISTFNQRFSFLFKFLLKSSKLIKKKNYLLNFLKLFFLNFSKYKQNVKSNLLNSYVWNIKRFLGKNRKRYKIKFKKFKFRYKLKNYAFFKTKNL